MTTLQNTRIAMVTIDCADPRAEARFWAELLGGEIAVEQDEYAICLLYTSPSPRD